jgi:hypothetical protein
MIYKCLLPRNYTELLTVIAWASAPTTCPLHPQSSSKLNRGYAPFASRPTPGQIATHLSFLATDPARETRSAQTRGTRRECKRITARRLEDWGRTERFPAFRQVVKLEGNIPSVPEFNRGKTLVTVQVFLVLLHPLRGSILPRNIHTHLKVT